MRVEIQNTYIGEITGVQDYGLFIKLGNIGKGLCFVDFPFLYKVGKQIIVKVAKKTKKGFILKLVDKCNLENVTIPDGVTTIGSDAFSNCTSLENVTIPNSVTAIGSYSFSGCKSLKEISIPDGVTTIGNGAFSGCTSLESVIISNSVTAIGSDTFEWCKSLKNITIPNKVEQIKEFAFKECSTLKEIIFPDSLKTINEFAFYRCESLESVKNLGHVEEVDKTSFYKTPQFKSTSLEQIESGLNQNPQTQVYVKYVQQAELKRGRILRPLRSEYGTIQIETQYESHMGLDIEDIIDIEYTTEPLTTLDVGEGEVPDYHDWFGGYGYLRDDE